MTRGAVCAAARPDVIKCSLLVFSAQHCKSTTLCTEIRLTSNIGIYNILSPHLLIHEDIRLVFLLNLNFHVSSATGCNIHLILREREENEP